MSTVPDNRQYNIFGSLRGRSSQCPDKEYTMKKNNNHVVSWDLQTIQYNKAFEQAIMLGELLS